MSERNEFFESLEKVIAENTRLKKEVEDCEKMIRVLTRRNVALSNKIKGRK